MFILCNCKGIWYGRVLDKFDFSVKYMVEYLILIVILSWKIRFFKVCDYNWNIKENLYV